MGNEKLCVHYHDYALVADEALDGSVAVETDFHASELGSFLVCMTKLCALVKRTGKLGIKFTIDSEEEFAFLVLMYLEGQYSCELVWTDGRWREYIIYSGDNRRHTTYNKEVNMVDYQAVLLDDIEEALSRWNRSEWVYPILFEGEDSTLALAAMSEAHAQMPDRELKLEVIGEEWTLYVRVSLSEALDVYGIDKEDDDNE